jgi:hypothetical protein
MPENWHVRLCVQQRLAYSAGVSPAGETVSSPVAWRATWRETKTLKPLDHIIIRMMASHQAVTEVNVEVASKVQKSEGRACNRKAKAAWGVEMLTETTRPLRRGGSDGMVARIC